MPIQVRHRPFGLEHPYADSPDQRRPPRPPVGEPVRIGVVTEGDVAEVACEWREAGTPGVHRLILWPVDADPGEAASLVGGEGHLAEAQAGLLEAEGTRWSVVSPPVSGPVSYTIEANGVDGEVVTTGPFDVQPLSRRPGGTLRVHGPADRLVGEPVWEGDDDGLHLVHLVLRLDPGEHVVGFGERFDALDQRGESLDATVFEQYKGQAAARRTYLPMPFAHVVPEDPAATPWGFHVATTRRTWYDVGRAAEGELRVTVALGGGADESVDLHVWTASRPTCCTPSSPVGTAEELPDWVFRLWASGNEWNTQGAVLDRMDRHLELDIPVGAVVIEAWSDEQGFAVFNDAGYDVNADGSAHAAADLTYPAGGHWPDPAGLVDELHRRDVKVVLWQIPLQKTRADPPAQVDDAQVLVDGRGWSSRLRRPRGRRVGRTTIAAGGSPRR